MIGYFWYDFVPKTFFGIRTATQVKNFTAITKSKKMLTSDISAIG